MSLFSHKYHKQPLQGIMVFGFGKKPVEYGGYVAEEDARRAGKEKPKTPEQIAYERIKEEERLIQETQRKIQKDKAMHEKARKEVEYERLPKPMKAMYRIKQAGNTARQVSENINIVGNAMRELAPKSNSNPFGNEDYSHMFDPAAVFGSKPSKQPTVGDNKSKLIQKILAVPALTVTQKYQLVAQLKGNTSSSHVQGTKNRSNKSRNRDMFSNVHEENKKFAEKMMRGWG